MITNVIVIQVVYKYESDSGCACIRDVGAERSEGEVVISNVVVIGDS